ncbi:DNA-deoxyinosine glycosylase [Campylobacter sp. faydin G-105]|uniref:DNA-deoxyinosine glycosylase n=1 Tax=Campylobacter anatolicus TaxID=2829105 RepID=UPI001B9B879F|nr:DNA-deoxyinosine glycosylase [Campylobacter anatolicus]MBR8462472.1 DNA-deoxyinosine glycosylase [Campylobacter anatolicus]
MSLIHPFEPIFDKNSKVLILGSFPSIVSREQGFYYANAQNRFWRVLAKILRAEIPQNADQKRKLLLAHGVAIYDAALSCSIDGSSDAAMTQVVPVNLEPIFKTANIKQVFANGGKAYEICLKFLAKDIKNATQNSVIKLLSTSPANAKFRLDDLVREWSILRGYLE